MNRRAFPFVDLADTVAGMRTDEPDAVLMAAFAAHDERAAAVLYDRFASRIYGLGIVMLGNDQAAQDLVQDTFVKVWRSATRFDPSRGRLETWVLLVGRSLAIDALRRRVLEQRSLRAVGEPNEADPAPGPDDNAVLGDMTERARRAMARLSPEQRAAVELAYFGGRTSAEVAELEGVPQGTVKTRIRAALLHLREDMATEADHDV
jgi:RNA polymerase sigma-70 factor (ECF subfamily)